MSPLPSFGFDSLFHEAFRAVPVPGLVPGRVVQASHERYRVVTDAGESPAEPTGRLRFAGELPAVGDFVAVFPGDPSVVHAVLPRRTWLVRRGAGREEAPQVLAANVDTVLVVTSCNADLSPARLARYLALAREGGARPVVVLSKADLGDAAEGLAVVARAAPNVQALAVSGRSGLGLERLVRELRPATTAVLVGSSGVGKSTLVNVLVGETRQETLEIRRSDGRGSHATTSRELLRLPSGALLIDTPGLREVGLSAGADVESAYGDVAELAAACRFRDCRHEGEPGCAVREAVASGRLERGRLEGLGKLRREAAMQELRARFGPGGADRRRWAAVMKRAK